MPRLRRRRIRAPRRRRCVLVVTSFFLSMAPAFAQEPDQQLPTRPDVHEHVEVTAAALTPTRETSGTVWIPAATPMYGLHRPWRGWDLRLDGVVFTQFLYEPGDRHRTGGAASRQFGSVNWGMAMARRKIGNGRFGVRTMLSAEPWTIGGCGSLNFLETGEVCENDTIHDRQQQHDTLMELAVDFEHPVRQEWRWQVYAGLAGEPALGPPGYPHRPSAMANPVAPVTHHWLDGSHITFGVVTVGIHNQRWKAETSVFNGRDPDESRVDLDLGGFDSVAARLSFLPTDRLAFQVSGGRLREARTDFLERSPQPATNMTASAIYHRPLGPTGIWATTIAVGAHLGRETIAGVLTDLNTSALLAESSVTVSNRHTLFGRAEVFGMPAHHLHAAEFGADIFTMGKLQLGYVRHLAATKGVVPGIGATASLSLVPAALAPRYDGRVAPSIGLFFNLRPARHVM
jgi:hypothetical protein